MEVEKPGQHYYDSEQARSYWRYAPSGLGKHDTRQLALMPDAELLKIWNHAFVARFRAYPEEDIFAQVVAQNTGSRRVLSIGSGLGFHEILYASHGAELTCADIVESNLAVINRIAVLKEVADHVTSLYCADSSEAVYGGPYDVVFIYGSLMVMPESLQRKLMAQAKASLAPRGEIILMLYTWQFARSTCGWNSPDQFDPLVFARVSDPSVGDEHCPWSDWHDDRKLLELAGPDMVVTRRQTWNNALYVWYMLQRGLAPVNIQPFFDLAKVVDEMSCRHDFRPDQWTAYAASAEANGSDVLVRTPKNTASYALGSATLSRNADSRGANCICLDVSLHEGALSVGILDVVAQKFVASQIITEPGRQMALIAADLPARYQVIISNYHPAAVGVSAFTIHQVTSGYRRWVSVPGS